MNLTQFLSGVLNENYKPAILVSVEGFGQIENKITALEYTDIAGTETDSVVLVLEDTPDVVPLATGTKINVSIGYELPGLGLHPVGQFEVTRRKFRSGDTGSTWTIEATSAPWLEMFKATREQIWQDTTLGEIIEIIASRNGFVPRIDPRLAAIGIEKVEQKCSDCHFITLLARRYGAIAKPDSDLLIFAVRYDGQTVDGETVSDIMDLASIPGIFGVLEVEAETAERGSYNGVKTFYIDPTTKKRAWATVGSEPFKAWDRQLPDEASAKSESENLWQGMKFQIATMQMQIPGYPYLVAGQKLTVIGLHPEFDGTWIVHSIVHTIGDSGYTSHLNTESDLEGVQ